MLCGTDESGNTRVFGDDDAADAMLSRFETMDAVYRQDWENVRNYHIDSDISPLGRCRGPRSSRPGMFR